MKIGIVLVAPCYLNKRREDPSEIGQFGVGFKAVYAYTNTPEIHSGEYDFKIIDMLLPEDNGVLKCSRKGVTQFIFPLGSDTKDTKTAVREIESGLRDLDGNAILFLSHIKRIRFKLPNNTMGSVSNEIEHTKFLKITVYHPSNNTPDEEYFLKFDKEVPVIIKGQKEKRFVSIAYRLIKPDTTRFVFDPSLQGKVFIYFPAEKETNNLRFHINAPFASTVARDSVRDCPENAELINKISELVCESIDWIKDNGYWDRSIYAVLPHSRDIINARYGLLGRIQSKVQMKFSTSRLIQIDKHLFVSPKECVQLGRNIAKIFTNNDFKQLNGRNFIYAAQPFVSTQPTTNEIHFFTDLSIAVIRENDFIKLVKNNPEKIRLLVKPKKTKWLCDFFTVLYDIWQSNQYDPVGLSQIKMILADNGEFYCAKEKIYIKSDYTPKNIKSPVYVNELLTENEKSRGFLIDLLKIPVMSSKEDNLEEITSGNIYNAVSGMIDILDEFMRTSNKQEFYNKYYDEPIFLAKHSYYGNLINVKASECCWTSAIAPFYEKFEWVVINTKYGKNYGYQKCNKILARDKYLQIFSNNEIEQLHQLFIFLGGNNAPKIISCDVEHNPLCNEWIRTHKFRRTNESKKDYTITGLENLDGIINENRIEAVLSLWKLVASLDDKYSSGYFCPSNNGSHWSGESTAVYYLKRKKWIPNRNGVFCRPCELTKDDLPQNFELIEVNDFLKTIGFGNKALQSIETITKIKEAAPEVNEQQQKLIALIIEHPELANDLLIQVNKERLGLLDAIKMQNKGQSQIQYDDDMYGKKKSVNNPEKRQEKQEKIFREGLKNPFQRTHSLHYTCTTANQNEKVFVYSQYKGRCQMCDAPPITKYDGKPHFLAVNIVRTDDLQDALLTNLECGWNTLSLCPTCAAKYLYCAKNIDSMIEQIQQINVHPNVGEDILLTIELMGKTTNIKFTPRHFIALKAAFEAYSKE